MHPTVQPAEVRDVPQDTPAPDFERVEQSHFDVRVGVERREHGIETGGVVVVEQQPNTDAAVGGTPQRREQHGTGHIVVPDVIPHVEGALGGIGQQRARREGIMPIRQGHDARAGGMHPHERRASPAKPGIRAITSQEPSAGARPIAPSGTYSSRYMLITSKKYEMARGPISRPRIPR